MPVEAAVDGAPAVGADGAEVKTEGGGGDAAAAAPPADDIDEAVVPKTAVEI